MRALILLKMYGTDSERILSVDGRLVRCFICFTLSPSFPVGVANISGVGVTTMSLIVDCKQKGCLI